MNISNYAEQLFFGKTLDDKLLSPEVIESRQALGSSQRRVDLDSPLKKYSFSQPGRLDSYPICKSQKDWSFPSTEKLLSDPIARAQVLHFFANHELLAIEIMAYTLLLFPESPSAFKNGLISTIKDEQKHLCLYLERMKCFGLEFGDLPLNDFFWQNMKHMASPLDFVTRMSLTFEQANLDFSLQYRDLFAQAGDHEGAQILDTIYQDEIRHVRYGLHWFDHWRPHETSRWQAFNELLPFPLTPQRAKGKFFSVSAREEAGIDKAFINQLKVYSASKGRLPKVFWFWPDCEEEWASANYNRPNNTQRLQEDLSFVPAMGALSSDLLILPQKPTTDFLNSYQKAGLSLPEIITIEEIDKLESRLTQSFEPWGKSPKNLLIAKKWTKDKKFQFLNSSNDNYKTLFSKCWSHDLLQEFLQLPSHRSNNDLCSINDCGRVCQNYDSVTDNLKILLKSHSRAVIKSPFGASGRNFLILQSEQMTTAQENWLKKTLVSHEEVIVEPWLEKDFDFSLQISVLPDGKSKVHGQARFLTGSRGQYLGALLGGFTTDLSSQTKRFLNDSGKNQKKLKEHFSELADFVALKAFEEGYTGPIGIDAFVFRNTEGHLKLRPIVETNCRYNMGRMIVDLEKKLNLTGNGLWRIFTKSEIKRMGHDSITQFEKVIRDYFSPLVRDDFARENFYFLKTTESINDEVCSYLFWGPNLLQLREQLKQNLKLESF